MSCEPPARDPPRGNGLGSSLEWPFETARKSGEQHKSLAQNGDNQLQNFHVGLTLTSCHNTSLKKSAPHTTGRKPSKIQQSMRQNKSTLEKHETRTDCQVHNLPRARVSRVVRSDFGVAASRQTGRWPQQVSVCHSNESTIVPP